MTPSGFEYVSQRGAGSPSSKSSEPDSHGSAHAVQKACVQSPPLVVLEPVLVLAPSPPDPPAPDDPAGPVGSPSWTPKTALHEVAPSASAAAQPTISALRPLRPSRLMPSALRVRS